jgi:hypothetical protein
VTEQEWLTCTDPTPMLTYSEPTPLLQFLQDKASERKLRLFGCACCRRIWHLLIDERNRKAVEAAEQYADGKADKHELDMAYEAGFEAASSFPIEEPEEPFPPAANAAAAAFVSTCWVNDANFWQLFRWAADASGEPTARSCQAALLHDLLGNPFRPVTIKPTWRTPTVTSLAQAAYEERSLPSGELDAARLAILADALEEAGCDNTDILNHCRQPGEHVRGCWVVDLVLGKE